VAWYFKGYPVGGALRAQLATVESLQQIDDYLAQLEEDVEYPGEGVEGPRGRQGTPKKTALPEHWLESRELSETQRSVLHLAEVDSSGG
jgi:hypothetical protein